MHREFSLNRRIAGVIALWILTTGIVWSQAPTPPPPQSPQPINPIPVKGALVQLENGERTYLRIEFPEPPSPALNPTTADWTLQIFDTPELGRPTPTSTLRPLRETLSKSYLLTSSGWSQGTPGQFTYSGAAGAVTAELDERTFVLKATGAEALANVDPVNEVGALLKIGGVEYFALIGGKVSSNVAGDFKAHGGAVPVIWETFATAQPITDLNTGQPVADAGTLANLQSALVFPDGGPGHKTRIEIALPDSCYSVEYLFSEIDPAIDSANPRRFLVTAEEVGVINAEVNPLQQLGSANKYYPGAYVASGPIRDGYFTTTFTRVEGDPIISGFIIQPLIGCTGIPNLTDTTPIVIDLGGETLPSGVYVYKVP